MKRLLILAAVVMVLGIAAAPVVAAEGKPASQTKTGIVKKVDADAKQVVVMVTRELTFTVTENTKITQRDEPRKLADIKPEAKVSVVYVKDGETRAAEKIAILGDK